METGFGKTRLFRLIYNNFGSYLFIYLSFEGSVYGDMGKLEWKVFILGRTIRDCTL